MFEITVKNLDTGKVEREFKSGESFIIMNSAEKIGISVNMHVDEHGLVMFLAALRTAVENKLGIEKEVLNKLLDDVDFMTSSIVMDDSESKCIN